MNKRILTFIFSLQGCRNQYSTMTNCLMKEKERIKRKEMELRARVFGLEEKPQEETPLVIPEKPQKIAVEMKS